MGSTCVFSDNNLTITVDSTNHGQTYKIYKLFDADVEEGRSDGEAGIVYKLMSGHTLPADNAWFAADSAGVVTAKDGIDGSSLATDAFRTWAESYGNELTAKEFVGDGNDQAFTGLDDGYYFITTTTGTLVTVTSIAPSMEVQDKNPGTSVDKEITASAEGTVNTTTKEDAFAQVGTTVNYQSRIPIQNGALNYVFKDIMSAGLTVNASSVEVYLVERTATGVADGAAQATGFGTPVVTDASGNDPDITIAFDQDWIHSNVGKDIIIKYSATVNANAVSAVEGNPNLAQIWWGNTDDELHSEDDAKVYTAEIAVLKTKNGSATEYLEGAGFKLKKEVSTGVYQYYKLDSGAVTWVTETDSVKGDEHLSGADGKVAPFTGLPDGTYYLEESTVPGGYNKADDVKVTIAATDYTATNLVHNETINNNSGTQLPSTGGSGTTMIYIIGVILLAGAGILLVTRRRMKAE